MGLETAQVVAIADKEIIAQKTSAAMRTAFEAFGVDFVRSFLPICSPPGYLAGGSPVAFQSALSWMIYKASFKVSKRHPVSASL